MYDPIMITGYAGTGKTTRAMGIVRERIVETVATEYQRILGMSFMHGARRRLDQKLGEACGGVPYRATTIDAFALSILNRWRTSLGVSKPFSPQSEDGDIVEGLFETRASFDWIRMAATKLLSTPTVGKLVGISFPLIVVDEFQDCDGPQLDLVKALSSHTQLLLAADDFQLLNPTDAGCSAVKWVLELEKAGKAIVEDLVTPRRTTNPMLLQAARCLRNDERSSTPTIPIICCPSSPAAASWIIRKVAMPPFPWKGSCALVSPSLNSSVTKTLGSCNSQPLRKNLPPIHFRAETSHDNEIKAMMAELGTSDSGSKSWLANKPNTSPLGQHVIDRVQHYCRLRGVKPTDLLVRTFAERTISTQRAFGHKRTNRLVSTIHGTKNREFDNVFVLWNPHTVGGWSLEEQRRLLYNAVTRAVKNCMVLVLANERAVMDNPVLSLLGPAKPAFAPMRKTAAKKVKASTKIN